MQRWGVWRSASAMFIEYIYIILYVLSYLMQCLYEVGIVFIIPFLYILLYLLFVKKLRLEVECLVSKKTRV